MRSRVGEITGPRLSIMITWEYHDYDYIHSEYNQLQLHCKLIMITIMITNTNVILHQYLLSYMYNTDINMLQCLHVVL